MKNKQQQEHKQQQEQENKYILENNNILIDLLLKNTKITGIINLLLDYNNINNYIEPIIQNQEYIKIQDYILNTLNNLTNIYIDLMKKQQEENNDNKKKN